MILRKAYKYRLRPNRKNEQSFAQFAGACRWVYNRGLARRKECWEAQQKSLSLFDQNKELAQLKCQEDTAWLKDVHSQILQQALGDLNLAFQAFFRRATKGEPPGYPGFRCRGSGDSFRYPQGVKVVDDKVYLPKIGWIRFRKSRELQGDLKQATVIREGCHWYISFVCEWEGTAPLRKEDPSVVGVDLGLEHFAICGSTEGIRKTDNPRFLQKGLAHLRYLSRQLSKKVKGSQNWKKAKARLQAFHAKVRAKRSDFLHKLSTALVKSHDVIVVESLNVRNLLQKSVRSMARAISDAGWRQFLQQLKYKCEHAGKSLIEAGKWFPSTQMCSNCGKRNKLPLRQRMYHCECGLRIHRDDNAAINLRAVGTTAQKACGAALV